MSQLPEVFGMDDNVDISKELQETRVVGHLHTGIEGAFTSVLHVHSRANAIPNYDRWAGRQTDR